MTSQRGSLRRPGRHETVEPSPQGHFRRERPCPDGVTEEHRLVPKTGGFRRGRCPHPGRVHAPAPGMARSTYKQHGINMLRMSWSATVSATLPATAGTEGVSHIQGGALSVICRLREIGRLGWDFTLGLALAVLVPLVHPGAPSLVPRTRVRVEHGLIHLSVLRALLPSCLILPCSSLLVCGRHGEPGSGSWSMPVPFAGRTLGVRPMARPRPRRRPARPKDRSANRDRGEPCGSAPPTPPCVRVRTRRFDGVLMCS